MTGFSKAWAKAKALYWLSVGTLLPLLLSAL